MFKQLKLFYFKDRLLNKLLVWYKTIKMYNV